MAESEMGQELAKEMNVGQIERWLSALGGGALILDGLRRRSWLGLAEAVTGGVLVYRGTTGTCPVYQALGVNTTDLEKNLIEGIKKRLAAAGPSREEGASEGGAEKAPEDGWIKTEKSIVINKPVEALYRFCHRVENLSRFMDDLESVREKSNHQSHWIAKASKGVELEWEAEMIDDKENERIVWRAIEDGNVENLTSIRFEKNPNGDGTLVRCALQYHPTQSILGAAFKRLFGADPGKKVEDGLNHLKQMMEQGEASTEAA